MTLPQLKIPKDEAIRTLNDRIKKGREIRENGVSLFGSFEVGIREERLWTDYNRAWVERALGEDWVDKYDDCVPSATPEAGIFSTQEETDFIHRMDSRILFLRGLLEKVPLMHEEKVRGGKNPSRNPSDHEIFIVHGHDHGARDAVKLFVKSLGATPIVLEDKPNESTSLDRKLGKYSEVDYVIAIFTPDDGKKPRSNVSLETGWFRAKIGEEKVAIVYKGDVEFPSDIRGVEHTLIDDHGGWRQKLARDIKHAGIEIDPDWFSNV
jgi:hypothetical protein